MRAAMAYNSQAVEGPVVVGQRPPHQVIGRPFGNVLNAVPKTVCGEAQTVTLSALPRQNSAHLVDDIYVI